MPPPDEPAGNMYEEMMIVNQDIAGISTGTAPAHGAHAPRMFPLAITFSAV